MENLQGRLLVAAPQLADPNFVRTVVLMVEHNDQGALGLVLNRPSDKTLKDLWEQLGLKTAADSRPVHVGGPVPGPLMVVHGVAELAEMEVLSSVFLSAKKAHIDQLVPQSSLTWKVFLGHSGWGAGQLERELSEGAWLTAAATPAEVFSADPELWEQVCKGIGTEFYRTCLGIRALPPDPQAN